MKRLILFMAPLLFWASFCVAIDNPFEFPSTRYTTVGTPVFGGTANRVLLIDADGNVAVDSHMQYSSATAELSGLGFVTADNHRSDMVGSAVSPNISIGPSLTSGFWDPDDSMIGVAVGSIWVANFSSSGLTIGVVTASNSITTPSMNLSGTSAPVFSSTHSTMSFNVGDSTMVITESSGVTFDGSAVGALPAGSAGYAQFNSDGSSFGGCATLTLTSTAALVVGEMNFGTSGFFKSNATNGFRITDYAQTTNLFTVNDSTGAFFGKSLMVGYVTGNIARSTLDVEGNLSVGANYSGTYAAPSNGAIIEGYVGIGRYNPTERLHVQGTGDTYAVKVSTGSSGQNALLVENDGDVIIPKTLNYAPDTASDDDYLVSIVGITQYTAGTLIIFKAVTANTGACTVDVNGIGAKALKSLNDNDPPDNYIESGSIVMAVYDGTNFQMIQPDANP